MALAFLADPHFLDDEVCDCGCNSAEASNNEEEESSDEKIKLL